MQCELHIFGQIKAEATVRRRPGSYSYECSDCGNIHVSEGDKTGRMVLLSNEADGRMITFFPGEIVSVDGRDIT